MKRLLHLLAVIGCLAFAFTSCEKPDSPSEETTIYRIKNKSGQVYRKASTTISLEYATIKSKKDKEDPAYTLYSIGTNSLQISFTSADESIFTVSKIGRVSGLKLGQAWLYTESAVTGQRDSILIKVVAATADENTFLTADWGWTKLPTGGEYGTASMTLFGAVQNISIIRYKEADYKTSITYYSGTDCKTVPNAATSVSAEVAINASFFNTTSLVASTTFTMGSTLVATSTDSEATNRSTGTLYLKGGNISFSEYNSAQIAYYKTFDFAIASGPLLILNNTRQTFISRDFNNNRHPRTMIGVTKDREIVMVVVDGRFTGYASGMTIPEMADLAGYLDLVDALNLDGGGSSTIWTSTAGVLNYPCDNSKWDHAGCRKCPTAVVAMAR